MKRCYADYYRQLNNNVIITLIEYNKVLIIELDTEKESTRKLNCGSFSWKGEKVDFLKTPNMNKIKQSKLNEKYKKYIADQYNGY